MRNRDTRRSAQAPCPWRRWSAVTVVLTSAEKQTHGRAQGPRMWTTLFPVHSDRQEAQRGPLPQRKTPTLREGCVPGHSHQVERAELGF